MSNAILVFFAAAYIGYLLGKTKGFYDGVNETLVHILEEVLIALKDDQEAALKVINHLKTVADKQALKHD